MSEKSTELTNIITALTTAAGDLRTGADGAEIARIAIISAMNDYITEEESKVPEETKLSELAELITGLLESIEVEEGTYPEDVVAAVKALDDLLIADLQPILESLQATVAILTATV
jgi:hypothetical protein